MKMHWSPRFQKLMPEGRQHSEFDSLPLPHSKNVAETHSADLVRILTDANVPCCRPGHHFPG
jgi:hypothetical protein